MPEEAGGVNIVLRLNSATYSAAIKEAQAQLDVFAGRAKGAGASTVSSMQASATAVRQLENPLGNNNRAIARFLTMIPGVGSALKMAFPIMGAVAMGSMIIGLGTKVVEFVQKVRAMPQAIANGFAALNLSQQTATDSINVLTDKLNDAHAAFEHKPTDGLKTGIDEAKEATDKFAESVVSANAKVEELLSKNHLTGWAILLGKVGTGDVDDSYKEYAKTQAHDAYVLAKAQHDGNTGLADSTKTAMAARRDGYLGDRQRDHDAMVNKNYGNQYGSGIAADEGIITTLIQEKDGEAASTNHAASEAQASKDEAAKKAAEDAKRIAAEAKAAREKAIQDMLHSMTDGMTLMKEQGDVSTLQQRTYWQSLVEPAQKYPEVLRVVNAHIGEANQALYKELEERWNKEREAAAKSAEEIKKQDDLMQRLSDEMDSQDHRTADYKAASTLATEKNSEAMAEQATAHDLATGAITKHDAAVQMAAAHAANYAAQIAALKVGGPEWTADNNDASMTPEQRAANQEQRNVKITGIQGEAARTAQSDQWKTNSETAFGGAADALREFVAASRDGAAQMRTLVNSTLTSLNAQLIQGMMGKSTNFKQFGSDVFKNVATTGLQKGESALIGMIPGMGKMGTKSNPMHVIMDSLASATKSVGGAVGAATSALGGAASGTAGKLGGFFGTLLKSVLPGFADGGYLSGPSIVGENGPELFNPSGSGHVTPNHKLTSGSSGDIIFHPGAIDARGATDPAQVDAQVQRGIRTAAPHLMAGSVQATREAKLRRPSRG